MFSMLFHNAMSNIQKSFSNALTIGEFRCLVRIFDARKGGKQPGPIDGARGLGIFWAGLSWERGGLFSKTMCRVPLTKWDIDIDFDARRNWKHLVPHGALDYSPPCLVNLNPRFFSAFPSFLFSPPTISKHILSRALVMRYSSVITRAFSYFVSREGISMRPI